MTTALRPTLARCVWTTPLFAALAVFVTIAARATFDMQPVIQETTLLTVAYIFGSVGFVVGIGGMDYWWTWIIGGELDPHDHSNHGAHSWRDYFKFNTDHKVIGVQYLVTTVFFLLALPAHAHFAALAGLAARVGAAGLTFTRLAFAGLSLSGFSLARL